MGIKLDWQVESEQSQVRATEDPTARLRRQHARRQLLAVLAALVCVLSGIGGLIVWRLWSVDNRIRQDLLDTVEIEVTALRIGDFANYMSIQRSASDAFMLEQSRKFEEYQQLKQTHRVELTGKVSAVTLDDQRGRVVLQEMIDGVPYQVVWFYWHYEDPGSGDQGGWRHVPDDLTFWGDAREIKKEGVRISYHALDEKLAQALALHLEAWRKQGCERLNCLAEPPLLRVEIVAERPNSLAWSKTDSWTLRITSPLTGRSRADLPLSPDLEYDIAQKIARRLVSYAAADISPQAYTDAVWLQMELARWLSGVFLDTNATPGFTESLIAGYGPDVPVKLLDAVRSGATLDTAITAITGVSMAQLTPDQLNSLNWGDFFQWRLDQESQLLAAQNSPAFLSLYDQEDLAASTQALARASDPVYAAQPVPQVSAVIISRDDQARTYAYITAAITSGDPNTTIIWRLSGGTWKRTN